MLNRIRILWKQYVLKYKPTFQLCLNNLKSSAHSVWYMENHFLDRCRPKFDNPRIIQREESKWDAAWWFVLRFNKMDVKENTCLVALNPNS